MESYVCVGVCFYALTSLTQASDLFTESVLFKLFFFLLIYFSSCNVVFFLSDTHMQVTCWLYKGICVYRVHVLVLIIYICMYVCVCVFVREGRQSADCVRGQQPKQQ